VDSLMAFDEENPLAAPARRRRSSALNLQESLGGILGDGCAPTSRGMMQPRRGIQPIRQQMEEDVPQGIPQPPAYVNPFVSSACFSSPEPRRPSNRRAEMLGALDCASPGGASQSSDASPSAPSGGAASPPSELARGASILSQRGSLVGSLHDLPPSRKLPTGHSLATPALAVLAARPQRAKPWGTPNIPNLRGENKPVVIHHSDEPAYNSRSPPKVAKPRLTLASASDVKLAPGQLTAMMEQAERRPPVPPGSGHEIGARPTQRLAFFRYPPRSEPSNTRHAPGASIISRVTRRGSHEFGTAREIEPWENSLLHASFVDSLTTRDSEEIAEDMDALVHAQRLRIPGGDDCVFAASDEPTKAEIRRLQALERGAARGLHSSIA
jgi:hypothetical protein